NNRSSHSELTIRGGGTIFVLALVLLGILHPAYWLIVIGGCIIGIISFIDDWHTLSNKIRLFFHLLAVTCLFSSLEVFSSMPIYGVVILFISVIGTINAYNFMDGINGITGLYSLVILGALQFVNYEMSVFILPDMIWLPILACLVFLFFNFRTKAKCFAGDVGSITISFWILYLILKVILVSGNYAYALFLLMYGLDAITTIMFRLIRRENIFEAHRSHFYQYLANERRIPHIYISAIYAVAQLTIIVTLLTVGVVSLQTLILSVIISFIGFIGIRLYIEGKDRLLKQL
ncbi:MAG TPA: UDP-GlcNAc--UDP-phosphate GlcNAc-1-phosphate transferase, partial [Pedobacter sp.]